MAQQVVMPQLGLSMDAGRIAKWLVKSGDAVKAGQVLLEVESDKATIEVEAVANGILHIAVDADAGQVRVGTVIGYLLKEGEAVPELQDRPGVAKSVSTGSAAHPTEADAPAGRKDSYPLPRHPSTPAARRRAAELGVNWMEAHPSGPRGQIRERDVLQLAQVGQLAVAQTHISPVARKMAEAFGLDVQVLGTLFPGRRIERGDVEQAVRQMIAGQAQGARPAVSPPARAGKRRPMNNLRRLIADRMAHSSHTAAPVTLTTEADATDLVRLRDTLRNDPATKTAPSYNVLLAKLTAIALLEFPDLNATIEGSEIVSWDTVNIGIAVETERGLVVPVLQHVQSRSLGELAAQAEELLGRARQGKALPDELAGGTFTITNLGAFDVDAFTPIINLPECAVLGVGRLNRKPVVLENDTTAVRTRMALSLTFDHRLVDGAPAARFLQRVKQFIEEPYLWLTRATNS